MGPRSLLLITSDELGWAELGRAVRSLHGVCVVGEATSAEQATDFAARLQPDVVICAARVEGRSALPLLVDLRHKLCPSCKIVVLAARLDPVEAGAFADLGLAGYLLWGELSRETVCHSLAAVTGGDVVISSRAVATTWREGPHRDAPSALAAVRLTAHERAVLEGLTEGHTRKEIAREAGLSERTVNRIVAALEEKLDAQGPVVLGVRAAQLGIV